MENLIKFLGSLQSFFNDFIGAVAPATILVAGILLIPGVDAPYQLSKWGEFYWLPATVALFALGHVLLGLASWVRKLIARAVASWQSPDVTAATDSSLRRLRAVLDGVLPLPQAPLAPANVRNIAMTLSSTAEDLGRRFTFLSQFCFGSGMAALIVGICWMVTLLEKAQTPAAVGTALLVALGGMVCWILLTWRGIQFQGRSYTLPFDAALGDVAGNRLGLPQTAGTPLATPATGGHGGTTSDPVTPGAPAPDVLPI